MNSRERVKATLNHKEPDRVPIDLGGWQSGISYETYILIKKKLNFNAPNIIDEPSQGLAKVDEEILESFGVDTRYVFMKPPKDWDGVVKEDGYFEDKFGIKWCHSFYDEWGVKLHRQKNSHYYEMIYRKLSTISYEELDTYSWPDPDAPSRNFGLKEEIKSLFENTNYSIFSCGPGIFEQSWGIYGLEEYMIKVIDDIKYIEKLLDKVLITLQGLYANFLDIAGPYLDVLQLWSDLGSQIGSLISPKFYREKIKPRDKELIKLLKSKTKAKIIIHSCGSIYDFIPDLIDAGYDGINPIQTTATNMDPVRLKKEFGKDLIFWGALDTQKILPFGKTEDVIKEAKKIIKILGQGGGYIFGPCHNIQANTPPENVIAMYEAAKEFCKYPINIKLS